MKTQPKKQEEQKSEVETKFKSGSITGVVFSKEVETEEYGMKKIFTYSISRVYTPKGEKESKFTSNMRKSDLAGHLAVLNKIHEFLYIHEDEEEETKE